MENEINLIAGKVAPEESLTAEKIRVQKVLDMISTGTPVKDAIKASGADKKLFQRSEVKAAIKEFIAAGDFTSDVVRKTLQTVRFVAFTQLMKEGLEEDNLGKIKLGVELGDQIAGQPDIGLKERPKLEINLEIGSLTELMGQVDKGEVIDVEAIIENG